MISGRLVSANDSVRWWGYATQWSLLDYPGVIIPVGFVDKTGDTKDMNYDPVNEIDKEHYELCKFRQTRIVLN